MTYLVLETAGGRKSGSSVRGGIPAVSQRHLVLISNQTGTAGLDIPARCSSRRFQSRLCPSCVPDFIDSLFLESEGNRPQYLQGRHPEADRPASSHRSTPDLLSKLPRQIPDWLAGGWIPDTSQAGTPGPPPEALALSPPGQHIQSKDGVKEKNA